MPELTLSGAARRLGTSVGAFKSEVHRLRLRFRALIREEVAATVSAPHEIEEELASLKLLPYCRSALARRRA